MQLRSSGVAALDAALAEAVGRGHRHDPVVPGSGGPAGNGRLRGPGSCCLFSSSASTGWRILRYYTGSATYRAAGPPPLLLRVLGPLVIASTVGVLGSGFALIAVGPGTSQRPLFTVLGQPVSPLTIHQGLFIVFAVITGLHVLARLTPAVLLASSRSRRGAPPVAMPGRTARLAALAATTLAGAIAVAVLVPSVTGWHHDHVHVHGRPDYSHPGR